LGEHRVVVGLQLWPAAHPTLPSSGEQQQWGLQGSNPWSHHGARPLAHHGSSWSRAPTLPSCHHHSQALRQPTCTLGSPPPPRAATSQCPKRDATSSTRAPPRAGIVLLPPPTHQGGSRTQGLGVPGPQEVTKKEGKACPLSCPAAAELLRRCLLSSQKQELNGPRCVAFPAALAGRSQKCRRRRRRRKGRAPLERGQ